MAKIDQVGLRNLACAKPSGGGTSLHRTYTLVMTRTGRARLEHHPKT
ncbi:hypothetical protein [Desulfosporosinus sp. OT]|nr:hypothetical protein [Desulfosporosinus sp. OT]